MNVDFLQNLTRFTRKKSKSSLKQSVNEKQYYTFDDIVNKPITDDVWTGKTAVNPDELLDYDTIRSLLNDTQFALAVKFVIDFLLSREYKIIPVDDSPEQAEMVEFLEDMINSLDTPFREVRKNLYRSIIYSFVVFEKVFEVKDGKVRYKGLYPLHPRTLQKEPFKLDNKGRLTHIHQTSEYGDVDLEIDKVLLYAYDTEFDEIQGHSILNRLKQTIIYRQLLIKSMVNFIRKHERPILFAKLENTNVAKKVRDMLARVRDDNKNITVGENEELGILETSHHGEAYFKAINYFDMDIFRSLGIGNLLLGDGSQTGSYSQSKIQIEVSTGNFNGFHEDISILLQKDFIDPVIRLNWGEDVPSPQGKFSSFVEDDLFNLLRELKPYVDNMTIDSQSDWLQRLIKDIVESVSDIEVDNETDKIVEDLLTQNVYMDDLPGKEESDKILERIL